MDFARQLWLRIETIHAVTYFGAESTAAAADAGIEGFWRSYFGFRAAPMGRVGAGVVEASFFNFAPAFVGRWVPEVWSAVAPERLLAARSTGAVATLRTAPHEALESAVSAVPLLRAASDRAVAAGRPLFAANRLVDVPEEPVAALWQLCTNLREHRGDGHVAALTSAGIDGIEAHVLIAAEQGNSPDDLQRTRGWTADDWAAAEGRCRERDLVDGAGGLTAAGRALRAEVEATTDALAASPFRRCSAEERTALLASVDPLARHISASGVIRYPNPMGLPPLRA